MGKSLGTLEKNLNISRIHKRENERSESLALTMKQETPLFFACCMCSGQSSLSTQIRISGFIRDQQNDENGYRSRGKGPKAITSLEYFFFAIDSPVLVVPLRTISKLGSFIKNCIRC